MEARMAAELDDATTTGRSLKRPLAEPYEAPAGGWGSVKSLARAITRERLIASAPPALMRQNKPDGFACVSCAWAKPADPHVFEFCAIMQLINLIESAMTIGNRYHFDLIDQEMLASQNITVMDAHWARPGAAQKRYILRRAEQQIAAGFRIAPPACGASLTRPEIPDHQPRRSIRY